MNVLLVAPQPFFTIRGTPIAVRNLARVLAEEGHRVDLLTYFHGEDVPIAGVTTYRIRKPPLVRSVPIGLSWAKVVCDAAVAVRALALAGRNRYDVVHGVEEAVFIAWLVRLRFGTPFVYDMDSILHRQIEAMGWRFRPLAAVCRALERAAIRRAAGVLPVCPALAEYVRSISETVPLQVLPDIPPHDPTTADDPPSELEKCPGTRLLYIGNLEEYQGVDLMVSGFRMVAEASPEATLFIIGGDEDRLARHRREAADLVDEGRVRFLGPRPLGELGRHLEAADILVSPRLRGVNTPMKIYSYMDAGKPILATRIHAHTQVLDDTTALLVDPVAGSMAGGIRRLIEDPALRSRLGEQARREVRAEYSVERYRERLRAFYARLPGAAHGGEPVASNGATGDAAHGTDTPKVASGAG